MVVWTIDTAINFTQFSFITEEEKTAFHELVKTHFDEFKPIGTQWPSLSMLRGEPKKHPDFFEIDGSDVIAISHKAADSLKEFLPGSIELLPIETDAGMYYALNVLNFIDCLDKDASNYVAAKDGTIVNYSLLEFYEDKLEGQAIFKIPQLPYHTLISDQLECICDKQHLKGLSFDANFRALFRRL